MEATLLTWNIRGFLRPDLRDLAFVIRSEGARIVLLQEVQQRQARVLGDALSMHVFWSFKHSPLGPLGKRWAEGLAILCSDPLANTHEAVLTPSERMWSYKRRVVQYAHIPSLALGVCNIHLASHRDHSARIDQANGVLSMLSTRSSAPNSVVAGDFNASQELDLYAKFEANGFRDAWIKACDPTPAGANPTRPTNPAGHTNPAGSASQRIDRILISPGLAVEAVRVPTDGPSWAKRSDHLPVTARLITQPSATAV
jgi:endonuclease/exonuclease/phosphatase family metal-dependent hydrolase